ncbi:MAG: hypothetical protein J1E83_07975 [Lachnospiraceae bacterium]|nr:hypothetical protein [Lachnospiraceae bacterium]
MPHTWNAFDGADGRTEIQFSQRKYLWGKYVWCMFDFASDGREEGDTKGLNDKGLMTRERKPTD